MIKDLITYDDGSVKPWVSYAIIAAAILVGGYFVYAAWTGGGGQLPVNMRCANENCGYVTERKPAVGDPMPDKCPECDQVTLYPAKPCKNCGTPVILNEHLGKPPPAKCPKCGSEVWYGR